MIATNSLVCNRRPQPLDPSCDGRLLWYIDMSYDNAHPRETVLMVYKRYCTKVLGY